MAKLSHCITFVLTLATEQVCCRQQLILWFGDCVLCANAYATLLLLRGCLLYATEIAGFRGCVL